MATTREWHLAARPHGEPVPGDFELVEVPVPEPADGQVVVRNVVMSVDPYMRGRMRSTPSYAPPWQVGEVMKGGAVGRVVASRAPELPEGSLVLTDAAWRETAVVDAAAATRLPAAEDVSPSWYLGVLGMPGLTAYAGLFRVGAFREGDDVFVSGAAGAVGSLVGQFARLRGAGRVVGSAGSPEKVAWLRDLGFTAAFSHRDGVARGLAEAAPDGIDLFFDNVGGDHLEAAVDALRVHGRAALCGAISGYNAVDPPPGPRNLFLMVGKRLTLRGFLVSDHADLRPEFTETVTGWLRSGDLVVRETVREGIEQAVPAFLDLLRGGNVGKMVVRLAPDPD
ncbi:NADP-dependent oxidoreductase [Geodermatophilus sp. DSM 44513]|uniref:NADP-dependent oxidoreductase n=1 Tax=Geodermatophilus sp. DSM 44513 TaxID=1528104 RepID=UPI0012810C9E|nr:NADP-dependent oxidoreductase [Geodermatophilus sp. DSM 44513]WNV75762.1 NADP-dependent oxidoreductase [Geodermatophilus sp. DSM 44513]